MESNSKIYPSNQWSSHPDASLDMMMKNASNQSSGWWSRRPRPVVRLQLLAFRYFSGVLFDDLLTSLADSYFVRVEGLRP